jgi:hypothetical protein
MVVTKITGPGLTGMAVSVALLWGCVIGERLILRRANLEWREALHSNQRLRQQLESEPVSAPLPLWRHSRSTRLG